MEFPKVIYCDFDGTVTKKDYLAEFLNKYAGDKNEELEELWRLGKIGSMQCLRDQIDLIGPMPLQELYAYIDAIEIDPGFKKFYEYIKNKGFKFVILSDGLDLFIGRTLKNNGLGEIKFFSNTLKINEGKMKVEFNNLNPECIGGAGTCKCSKAQEDEFCYIGDGLSDLCVSKHAKVLFAKKHLKKYCKEHKIGFIPFEEFNDLYEKFANKES